MLLWRMSAGLLLSLKAWPCLPPTFITLGADFAVIIRDFSLMILLTRKDSCCWRFVTSRISGTFSDAEKFFASLQKVGLAIYHWKSWKSTGKWQALQTKDRLSSHVSLHNLMHLLNLVSLWIFKWYRQKFSLIIVENSQEKIIDSVIT